MHDQDGLTEDQISQAIEELVKLGYVETFVDKDGGFHFSLTNEGIKFAQEIQNRENPT